MRQAISDYLEMELGLELKANHDEKMLELLFRIIDVTEVGIPLGFYTSQWLSNWYLQGLDHFIKEQLCAVHYMRYLASLSLFLWQQPGA